MAANPFLFHDEPTNEQATSNPFLMDDEPCEDNPFLPQPGVAPSNPFAFDPMDLEVPTESQQDFFPEFLPPQKPTDLDLKFSYQNAVPTRPPPPRPPQSKETQDLLMSVMGEMDATSTHLLDKIPPTRTPSPVSMRDLQSPSPTPEPSFGELLDVGDAQQHYRGSSTEDLLSLASGNDINQNPHNAAPAPVAPARPIRPPRPAPPQKPPPPTTVNGGDIIDFFDAPPPAKLASKADILNLYNAPKKELVQPDLLCDSVPEPPSLTPSITENLVGDQEPSGGGTPTNQGSEAAKDSLRSPEVDLQMDTSDSQSRGSKGSVSSVTFNPFATSEDVTRVQDLTQSPDRMEVFSTPAPAPTPIHDTGIHGMYESEDLSLCCMRNFYVLVFQLSCCCAIL